jgi:hypothetical protein
MLGPRRLSFSLWLASTPSACIRRDNSDSPVSGSIVAGAESMESSRWYVKLGGESIGPLTDTEFRELARNGSIAPETAVSSDQLAWVAAGTIQGLTFPQSPPPALPIRSAQHTTRLRAATWALVGIGGAALFGLFLIAVASTPQNNHGPPYRRAGPSPPPPHNRKPLIGPLNIGNKLLSTSAGSLP